MNAFLLSVGVAIALALITALVAPFFIDWSSQRNFFEAQLSEAFGHPVSINGDLSLRIIPFPTLNANVVHVGESDGPLGVPLIIDGVYARMALTPLMKRELKVTDLQLDHPRLRVAIARDGAINLGMNGVNVAPGLLPVKPTNVAIDQLDISGGEIEISDTRNGRSHTVSEVNMSGSMQSLDGPFKLEGSGWYGTSLYSARLATGRFMEDGALRVKIGLNPTDRPLGIDLDGIARFTDAVPEFAGRLTLERILDEGSPEAPLKLDAALIATPASVTLEKLGILIGPEDRRITLSGAATVELAGEPKFDAVLSARQIDVDRTVGGGADRPATPEEAFWALTETLSPNLVPMPGKLSIDVESLVVSGNLVEQAAADLVFAEDRWRVDRAEALGPGRSSVALAGTINLAGELPEFTGDVRVDSRQSDALVGWLFGSQDRLPGLGAVSGPLEVASSISFGREGFVFDGISVGLGDTSLSGSIAYEFADGDKPAALDLAIEADRFDATGLTLAEIAAPPEEGDAETLLTNIQFRSGTVVLGQVEAEGVSIDATISGTTLDVRDLEVQDIGGASVVGAGNIADMSDRPDGTFELHLEASALEGLSQALGTLGYTQVSDILVARAETLAPASIDLNIAAARDGDASEARLTLLGTAGGTDLSLELRMDGRFDRPTDAAIFVSGAASNEDGNALLRQIGLEPLAGQAPVPGLLELQIEGQPSEGVPFTLVFAGLGAQGSTEGIVTWHEHGSLGYSATANLSAPDPASLFHHLEMAEPRGLAGPVEIAAGVSGTRERVDLTEILISVNDYRAQGTMSAQETAGDWRATGELVADAVVIPWLVSAVLGSGAFPDELPDKVFGDPAWPREAFGDFRFPGVRARIDIATPRLELAYDFGIDEASLVLAIDPQRIAFENMRGVLWGGDASGDLTLRDEAGSLRLDTQFSLAGADIAEIVWQREGRSVATGEVDLSVELSGDGRSQMGLVSTLSGSGSFEIRSGVLRSMNPQAFDQIVNATDAGMELDENQVKEVFTGHLDAGVLTFETLSGAFAVSSGVARARNVKVDTDSVDSFASASVDLTILGLDSEWSMKLADEEATDGRTREVGIVFAGPVSSPSRSIDVNPLLGYLTVRAFEQEVERLENLQSQINERQRLRRELIRLGQERVRRERETQEHRLQQETEQSGAEETPSPETAQDPEASSPEATADPDQPESADDAAAAPTQEPPAEPAAAPQQNDNFRQNIENVLRDLPQDNTTGR